MEAMKSVDEAFQAKGYHSSHTKCGCGKRVDESVQAAAKAYEAAQMILAKAKAQMRNREAWLCFGHSSRIRGASLASTPLQPRRKSTARSWRQGTRTLAFRSLLQNSAEAVHDAAQRW